MPFFLSFLWRGPSSPAWNPVDTVCEEHPIDYIARARLMSTVRDAFEYHLLFFAEIPQEVYDRHRPPTLG